MFIRSLPYLCAQLFRVCLLIRTMQLCSSLFFIHNRCIRIQSLSTAGRSVTSYLHPLSDQSVQGPQQSDGSRGRCPVPWLRSLCGRHGLSASPPDGLSPFNAGVAAHGGKGTPMGGDRESVSRPPCMGPPWGTAAHDTGYDSSNK